MAIRIAGTARAAGRMCFQAIVDEAGRAAVFEINARFGGAIRWLTERGDDDPVSVEERLGLPRTAGNIGGKCRHARYDLPYFSIHDGLPRPIGIVFDLDDTSTSSGTMPIAASRRGRGSSVPRNRRFRGARRTAFSEGRESECSMSRSPPCGRP